MLIGAQCLGHTVLNENLIDERMDGELPGVSGK